MKRLILSAVTASMLAASALSGQAAPLAQPGAPQPNYTQIDWQKPAGMSTNGS
jgi:Ni/Co efflux regulator RcnB